MTSETILRLVILLILLALSGFFSSAETAMTTVNRIRIRTMAEQNNHPRAKIMMKILERSDKMLSAILIGNNIVNLSASALATALTMRLFGNAAVGIATGIMTLLVLIFGEITPKTLAAANAENLSLSYAPVIWVMMNLMTPLIFLVDRMAGLVLRLLGIDRTRKEDPITQQELRTLVDAGHEEGVLESQEHRVISNVFDLMSSQVREVMVPRVDMITVSETDPYRSIYEVFKKEKLSRLPVYRENRENIVGIINIRDFLFWENTDNFDIHQIMYDPWFTFESKNTSDLLVEMREHSVSLSIVLDEYGQTVGMVTLEDLLEELVGQIRDEYDADEMNLIRQVGDGVYEIEGSVHLDDVNDALGTKLVSEDYDSIGGYIIGRLDHLPAENEEVTTEEGDILRVLCMDKNRIDTVRLTRRKDPSPPSSDI